MLDYNVCFIKQGSRILLLNREKPTFMGAWDGIGGKIKPGESLEESVIREVYEETGIKMEEPEFKGITTWALDGKEYGGMYTYFYELPDHYEYNTPVKSDEGILDWKELDWIVNPENIGIAQNIPRSIQQILSEHGTYEYRCIYENDKLVHYQSVTIPQDIDSLKLRRRLEFQVKERYARDKNAPAEIHRKG